MKAYETETVAAALYVNGLKEFSRSIKYQRPRGFFCAIGRCSACMMEVDGVPIITRHTIVKALGTNEVKCAIMTKLNRDYTPVKGSEFKVDCGFICIGVGLNPAYDLIQLFKPKMVYNGILGGMAPIRDKTYRFAKNAYTAGDCGSIEEATTAMLEGGLAGLYVTEALGLGDEEVSAKIEEYTHALKEDRGSPFSERLKKTIKDITVENIEEALN